MLNAIQLGKNSGLRVSELCLGTMNFGKPGEGHQGDWTLDIDQARPIFKAAIDHGLFYFDCTLVRLQFSDSCRFLIFTKFFPHLNS